MLAGSAGSAWAQLVCNGQTVGPANDQGDASPDASLPSAAFVQNSPGDTPICGFSNLPDSTYTSLSNGGESTPANYAIFILLPDDEDGAGPGDSPVGDYALIAAFGPNPNPGNSQPQVAPTVTCVGAGANVARPAPPGTAVRVTVPVDGSCDLSITFGGAALTGATLSRDITGYTLTSGTFLVAEDTTPPDLTAVSIASNNADPTVATPGDVITLTFTATEVLSATPTVTLAGQSVTPTNTAVNTWRATATVDGSTPAGAVAFAITNLVDAAGNTTAAPNNTTTTTDGSAVTVDSGLPTVTIAANPTALSAGQTSAVTFTLSVASTNFEVGDVTVEGGTLSAFSGSGTSYTATFTPTAGSTTNGEIFVAAATFTDAAGNDNAASAVTTLTVDTVVPTVKITAPAETRGPFEIQIAFSEAMSGFDAADITVSNAVVSRFSGSGATYRATVTPTNSTDPTSTITLSVAAAVATDFGGTPNAASQQVSVRYINETLVRERTRRVIGNFIGRRANNIASAEPDLTNRLPGSGAGGDGNAVSLTSEGSLDNNVAALATSFRQIMQATAVNKQKRLQDLTGMMALGMQRLPGTVISETGFDVWIKGSISRTDQDTASSNFSQLNIGADYRFSQDLVVGLLVQFDWSDETDSTENISASGTGWLAGPYLVARLTQNLILDARAAYGLSDNEVSPFGTYEDSFDASRLLVRGKLTGDFEYAWLRFAPHLALIYFEETQDAYTDSLDVYIFGQTVRLGRLTFGPKVSGHYRFNDGLVIAPHIGVTGIWDFEAPKIVNIGTGKSVGEEGLRARVDAGLALQMTDGIALNGEAFYDGLGADDFESYGGSLKLTIPLQK